VNINVISCPAYGKEVVVGHTLFIFVAKDRKTGKPAKAPPLDLQGDLYSQEQFRQGQERGARRRERAKESLTLTPPKPDEITIIHSLYLDSFKRLKLRDRFISQGGKEIVNNNEDANDLVKEEVESKWMEHSVIKNTLIMHAQDRNLHEIIFGGFLMRTGKHM
jgi:acyl-coenzyme A thioesterase 9